MAAKNPGLFSKAIRDGIIDVKDAWAIQLESLCERYHKLPSEILSEPVEYLNLLRNVASGKTEYMLEKNKG